MVGTTNIENIFSKDKNKQNFIGTAGRESSPRAIVFSYTGIKISDLTLWESGIIFVLNNEIKFNKNKKPKNYGNKIL